MTPPIPAPYLQGLAPQLDRCDSVEIAKRIIRRAREKYEKEVGELIEPEPVAEPDQYDGGYP